jgi:hypothetical protein
VNEEEKTPDNQPGAEQGVPDRDMPGSEAEDVPQTEEEVRARIEEQIRNLRVQDLMVESVVSVLNLTARRIAKEDEQDLEQGRVGIDAVRAWVDLLPDEAANQIRNALSELQMLYAQKAEGAAQGEGPAGGGRAGAEQGGGVGGAPGSGAEDVPRGGQEPPPRIWTPPGSN